MEIPHPLRTNDRLSAALPKSTPAARYSAASQPAPAKAWSWTHSQTLSGSLNAAPVRPHREQQKQIKESRFALIDRAIDDSNSTVFASSAQHNPRPPRRTRHVVEHEKPAYLPPSCACDSNPGRSYHHQSAVAQTAPPRCARPYYSPVASHRLPPSVAPGTNPGSPRHSCASRPQSPNRDQ